MKLAKLQNSSIDWDERHKTLTPLNLNIELMATDDLKRK